MMRRRRTRWAKVATLAAGALLLLGGCARHAPEDSLKPRGYYAHQIWNLIWPVFIVAGVIGVIVVGGVILFSIRYRVKSEEDWLDDRDMPAQIHGNFRLELGWTVLPALILTVVGVFTVLTVLNLAKEPPKQNLHVEVVGQQWWWEFRYDLNHDGRYDTNELVTADELVIPAGEKVALRMMSRDVMHGWWVPRLNGKRDTVPGHPSNFAVEADKPGEYFGQCTVFCGLSHANMRFKVIALSRSGFDTWLQKQRQPAPKPTTARATAGQTTFNSFCSGCHRISGGGAKAPPAKITALLTGAAPNLTHLMSRTTFAGGNLDLRKPTAACKAQGIDYGVPSCVNAADLRAWISNAPSVLPMAPTQRRGMPAFPNLTPGDLDNLVAYLETLK